MAFSKAVSAITDLLDNWFLINALNNAIMRNKAYVLICKYTFQYATKCLTSLIESINALVSVKKKKLM